MKNTTINYFLCLVIFLLLSSFLFASNALLKPKVSKPYVSVERIGSGKTVTACLYLENIITVDELRAEINRFLNQKVSNGDNSNPKVCMMFLGHSVDKELKDGKTLEESCVLSGSVVVISMMTKKQQQIETMAFFYGLLPQYSHMRQCADPAVLAQTPMEGWQGVEINEVGDIVSVRLFPIRGPIPDSIENLRQLRTLDLYNNYLRGPIPDSLGKLTQLQTLVLSNNQLTGHIPSSMGNLRQLRTLKLSRNHLTGPIPSFIENLTQLRTLDLSSNHLTGPIPSFIGKLTQLQSSDFSNNQLTRDPCFVEENIQRNPPFNRVFLSWQKIFEFVFQFFR